MKNLLNLTKNKEEKTEIGCERIDGEKGDLVEIRYCSIFSGVELLSMLIACRLSSALLERQISSYLPAFGS